MEANTACTEQAQSRQISPHRAQWEDHNVVRIHGPDSSVREGFCLFVCLFFLFPFFIALKCVSGSAENGLPSCTNTGTGQSSPFTVQSLQPRFCPCRENLKEKPKRRSVTVPLSRRHRELIISGYSAVTHASYFKANVSVGFF